MLILIGEPVLSRESTVRELLTQARDHVGIAVRGGEAREGGVGFVEDAEAGERDGGGEV